jgi:cytochrome c oxidase subunit IV
MTESTDLVTLSDETPATGEDASGGAVVPAGDQHPVPAHGDADHPGPRQYVLIAVVLVILTGVEVAVSYLEGHINSNVIVVVLAVMAAIKFFLVAAWYMHMKQDSSLFRRMFVGGIILACFVYGVVLFFFSSTVLKS